MTSNLDIYRAANVLIREHVEDAALEAAQRLTSFPPASAPANACEDIISCLRLTPPDNALLVDVRLAPSSGTDATRARR